jgi:GABA permease
MRRYLVVANQTLGGEHLLDKVRECVAAGPCHFHVLVPASPPHDHLTATEGQARTAAQRRMEEAVARFRQLGTDVDVDGSVGDARPAQAVADLLRHHVFDEIILSTFPPGPSRWLRQDLVHRLERMCTVPVAHIVSDRVAANAS